MQLTGDTYIFRFGFPDPEYFLGLPIGKHVIMNANIKTKEHPEGELIERKYTPISEITNQGYVDFVIKIYRRDVVPRFPDGGIMTQYLESLSAGAEMKMEGPKGRLQYNGDGIFEILKIKTNKKT